MKDPVWKDVIWGLLIGGLLVFAVLAASGTVRNLLAVEDAFDSGHEWCETFNKGYSFAAQQMGFPPPNETQWLGAIEGCVQAEVWDITDFRYFRPVGPDDIQAPGT